MIKGMTGFGSVQLAAGKIKGVIEVKSQNHRYLDIAYHLPIGFASIEDKIRQLINKEITRGRVIVSLKITEKPLQSLEFHKDAIHEYLKYAKILKKEFELESNLTLSDLIRLPGVVEIKESSLDVDGMWPSIEKSLKQALKSLASMRKREGRSLFLDITGVLNRMFQQIRNIKKRAQALLKEKKSKLNLDEFSSFQKGADVNEEIIRLSHYVQEFKLLLKLEVNVGKKLDFIAQEMQRETNTIGAKLQDEIVSNAVVALKNKIEKLREQAQNIE